MEKVIRLIDTVNNVVWGMSGILMLLGCGMYFTFRLKFFQITKLSLWTKQTFGSLFKREKAEAGQITPYKAVASALASSVGTGNIVGVATAIAAGGPGAVFWMWISAFFGMATKYGEILLAVKFREKKKDEVFGGPMYYIEKGLGKNYRWLAVLFSISGIFACFGMGGMSQANAISSIIAPMGILSKKSIGIILGIMAFAVISGGISRISSAAAFLVPIMAGAYLLCGIAVLFIYPENVVMAMGKIFICALSPAAIYGATSGLMVKNALRFGFARGVSSNEAGLGSAPMIHASAKAKSPAEQGDFVRCMRSRNKRKQSCIARVWKASGGFRTYICECCNLPFCLVNHFRLVILRRTMYFISHGRKRYGKKYIQSCFCFCGCTWLVYGHRKRVGTRGYVQRNDDDTKSDWVDTSFGDSCERKR